MILIWCSGMRKHEGAPPEFWLQDQNFACIFSGRAHIRIDEPALYAADVATSDTVEEVRHAAE
jgi:hypothetical protein